MKLISVALAALSAAAVQSAVLQQGYSPGQAYGETKSVDTVEEVKRSADAMSSDDLYINRWCNYPGQVCGKAKRAVDALDEVRRSADSVAKALAFLNALTPEEFQQIQ